MRKLRFWPPGIAALIICLAVIGCGRGPAAPAGEATVPPGNGNQPAVAGGAGAPGAPGPNGSAAAKGAPAGNQPDGGNGSNNGPAARGAPIMIPAIVHTAGFSISLATKLMIEGEPGPPRVAGLAEECGGHLCVTIAYQHGGTSDDDAIGRTECQFLGRTTPEMGTNVHSGDTIVMLTGNLPCTSPPGDDGSSGTDQSPPSDGQAPDTGSPQAGVSPSPADSTSP
jgi:hypothetical protein